jgi:hypothetical protein
MWKKLLGVFGNPPARDGAEECEPLFVVPRPVAEPRRCPETSICPYLNGTAGQHYRR